MKSVAAAVLLALLAGCMTLFSAQRDDSRFFALSVTAQELQAPAASPAHTIAVGPVRLPDYLDRNEICTRVSEAELHYSDRDRWAAPLRTSLPNVLIQDLTALAPAVRIVSYPAIAEAIEARIEVDVQRFEADADGKATLLARWTVRHSTGAVLAARSSRHVRDVPPGDTRSAVTALSETLAELAREIVSAFEVASPLWGETGRRPGEGATATKDSPSPAATRPGRLGKRPSHAVGPPRIRTHNVRPDPLPKGER